MRSTAVFVGVLLATIIQVSAQSKLNTCKYIPTDDEWPQDSIWESFNETVGGILIKTIPVGSVCHDPTYDEAKCQVVQGKWRDVDISLDDPASIQEAIFLNKTCDPFTDRSVPCKLGAYPVYSVNVSSPSDVIDTIEFVKEHNIRLVVKNTGHDFMGRVVGTGAVSIWTHTPQEREWFDAYEDPWSKYKGPAVRVHSGVLGEQLFQDAHARGYSVVTGECSTVGFSGGYIQGGGHSVLSTYLGMAADQVLSFEVITTSGQFVNVSTTEHPDLFWALRGGGGGAFAIVWTVTVKVFPDIPLAVGNFSFNQNDNGERFFGRLLRNMFVSGKGFWMLMDLVAFTMALPSNEFSVSALILPNKSLEEFEGIIAPLFQAFDELNLNYSKALGSYPTYLDGIQSTQVLQIFPVNVNLITSRLVPGSFFHSEKAIEKYMNITREILSLGLGVAETLVAPGRSIGGVSDNAVLPLWRTAERSYMPARSIENTDSLEKLYGDVDEIKTVIEPMIQVLGSGAYLNENNPFNPNWKQDFYGVNYDRLLEIKDKYDPDQLLYGSISVGGDRWAQQEDGRLCQTSSDTTRN